MKFKKLWLVRIIWQDACIHFGKDLENQEPGETQMSFGILLPKYFKDKYGKMYLRLLQNYGERQDDGTDIPRSWVVEIKKIARIPFEYIAIQDLMKKPFTNAQLRRRTK